VTVDLASALSGFTSLLLRIQQHNWPGQPRFLSGRILHTTEVSFVRGICLEDRRNGLTAMCFITGQVHSITPHRFLMSFFVANLLATISQLQESARPISSTATHGLAHGQSPSSPSLAETSAGFTLGGGRQEHRRHLRCLIGCSSALRLDLGEAVTTDIAMSPASGGDSPSAATLLGRWTDAMGSR